jgi:hypothetical protein
MKYYVEREKTEQMKNVSARTRIEIGTVSAQLPGRGKVLRQRFLDFAFHHLQLHATSIVRRYSRIIVKLAGDKLTKSHGGFA